MRREWRMHLSVRKPVQYSHLRTVYFQVREGARLRTEQGNQSCLLRLPTRRNLSAANIEQTLSQPVGRPGSDRKRQACHASRQLGSLVGNHLNLPCRTSTGAPALPYGPPGLLWSVSLLEGSIAAR